MLSSRSGLLLQRSLAILYSW